MEKPVVFPSREGQKLFGILHVPDTPSAASKIGVNLLNPGLKGRVAPNRINVRIARMLCSQGFPVLRFDAHGIGDSEGALAAGNELNMDLWGVIQRGSLVSDTLLANDVLANEAGARQLVHVGQCGGAVTAALAAARDHRVIGAILVDLPVRLVSSKLDMADLWMDLRTPDEVFRDYLKKAFNGRSWLNLIRMRSDFSAIRKVFSRHIEGALKRKREAAPSSHMVSDRFLWPLREACDSLLSRDGVLKFVFAENDFSIKEFTQDLLPLLTEGQGNLPANASMHVIKDANHIYTEEAWQAELLCLIGDFFRGPSISIGTDS